MKECEDFSEVVKRSKIDLVEEFKKTLQDEITKTIEEADKEMINNCKKLSHENMKRSEVDFSEEYKKQLENDLLSKNIVKFARKFKMCICCVGTAEGQYDLLKQDFDRFYPNLNFQTEWQKVVEE